MSKSLKDQLQLVGQELEFYKTRAAERQKLLEEAREENKKKDDRNWSMVEEARYHQQNYIEIIRWLINKDTAEIPGRAEEVARQRQRLNNNNNKLPF